MERERERERERGFLKEMGLQLAPKALDVLPDKRCTGCELSKKGHTHRQLSESPTSTFITEITR